MSASAAIGSASKLLGRLAALQARTDAAEKSIAEAAAARLSDAMAERETMRPRALLDPIADERYQTLTGEIGHLRRVVERSRLSLRGARS